MVGMDGMADLGMDGVLEDLEGKVYLDGSLGGSLEEAWEKAWEEAWRKFGGSLEEAWRKL